MIVVIDLMADLVKQAWPVIAYSCYKDWSKDVILGKPLYFCMVDFFKGFRPSQYKYSII